MPFVYMNALNNPILESTRHVIQNARFVHINRVKVAEFAEGFEKHADEYWLQDSPFALNSLNDDQKLMFLLVFNAISFSYWGDPYWNASYKEEVYTRGSWSLVACIFRALEEGIDILNPKYLRTCSKQNLAQILRGNTEIPLIEERTRILNEIGSVLIERFDGDFTTLVRAAKSDASLLLSMVLEAFPSFRDSSYYMSKPVYFQKRAQALVEGIYSIFDGEGYGKLFNIGSLTACADYVIPNVLHGRGILEYSDSLRARIDNKEVLSAGSSEEIEIRSGTIWAVELIRRELERKGIQVSAFNINDHLWLSGVDTHTQFHRTRTTAY